MRCLGWWLGAGAECGGVVVGAEEDEKGVMVISNCKF